MKETHQFGGVDMALFEADPRLFIESAIKEYVISSPINRLATFDNVPLFDEPVVAFANGDDSIFQDYKTIIGDFHLTPREVMEMHVKGKGWRYGIKKGIENISVISYALPIPYETRLSERQTSYGGSLRYNHNRWLGGAFTGSPAQYVASLLEVMGHNAVVPSQYSKQVDMSGWMAASWSERHIAYASGLGTFGLNGLIITPKGNAVYLGSVVCDVALTPSPRYQSHVANCLFYKGASCRSCISRCSSGAISEKGRDNVICRQHLTKNQHIILKDLGLDKGLIGRAPACGLCSTKVPCEDKIPALKDLDRV